MVKCTLEKGKIEFQDRATLSWGEPPGAWRCTEGREAQDSGTIKHTACPILQRLGGFSNNRCSLLLWMTGGQYDSVGVINESTPNFVCKICSTKVCSAYCWCLPKWKSMTSWHWSEDRQTKNVRGSPPGRVSALLGSAADCCSGSRGVSDEHTAGSPSACRTTAPAAECCEYLTEVFSHITQHHIINYFRLLQEAANINSWKKNPKAI